MLLIPSLCSSQHLGAERRAQEGWEEKGAVTQGREGSDLAELEGGFSMTECWAVGTG